MTRDEAVEHLKEWKEVISSVHRKAIIDMAIEALSEDKVYCMNCKHGEERIEDYRCRKLDEDWDIRFSPTHFCSWAERREP